MDDDIMEIVAIAEATAEKTRQRHERETKAQIGKMLGISRELVRQTGIVKRTFSDGMQLLESGQASINRLYNLAIGDTRVGLYVKVAPELKEAAKDEADRLDMTLSEFVAYAITTQIFG